MKNINELFKQESLTQTQVVPRNNKEALILDIVNATSERNKKSLARRLAIAMNTCKWSETDLHALFQKRHDPSIRNYTAFVKWSCTIRST